jgi:hypothetical protein
VKLDLLVLLELAWLALSALLALLVQLVLQVHEVSEEKVEHPAVTGSPDLLDPLVRVCPERPVPKVKQVQGERPVQRERQE